YLDDFSVTQQSPFMFGNDMSICAGDSLVLDATTPNATYQWQDGSTNATFTASQAGSYAVTVTVNGFSSSDTIAITVDPLPMVNLGTDTALCAGDVRTLNAALPNATYTWQNGSTDSTFVVTQPGLYWVTVGQNNCFATDSIAIGYNPLPLLDLGGDTAICAGTTLLLDATSPGAAYLWQDGSTNAVFPVTLAGTYAVTVTANGCSARDSVQVGVNLTPTVDLGNDTVAGCRDTTIILAGPGNGLAHLWSTGDTLESITVSTSGIIALTVTDQNGCQASDTVQTIFQGPCVGLAATPVAGALRVFPVPTSGWLTVEMPGIRSGTVRIWLVNTAGQVVYREQHPASSHQPYTINLEAFPAGVYQLQVHTARGMLIRPVVVH
ncbi:MAG: T9SS type A sorting domain-containing protein, partial [Bacteroidota bacterium]